MNLLPHFICCHLIGDFLLQNDEMASMKARYSGACFTHVLFYSVPFWIMCIALKSAALGLVVICICVQHFLQDRFQLHLRWMRFYGQTPPERWPTGPLCVDQVMHIAAIYVISLFFGFA